MSKTSRKEAHVNKDLAQHGAENYAMARDVARLGYQPNRGVTIAAFTPQQEAAMRGTNEAAMAFGMPGVADPMAGMPRPQTSASGIRGYSSSADYDQMLRTLPAGYRKSIEGFFADPNVAMKRTAPVNTVNRSGRGKK